MPDIHLTITIGPAPSYRARGTQQATVKAGEKLLATARADDDETAARMALFAVADLVYYGHVTLAEMGGENAH